MRLPSRRPTAPAAIASLALFGTLALGAGARSFTPDAVSEVRAIAGAVLASAAPVALQESSDETPPPREQPTVPPATTPATREGGRQGEGQVPGKKPWAPGGDSSAPRVRQADRPVIEGELPPPEGAGGDRRGRGGRGRDGEFGERQRPDIPIEKFVAVVRDIAPDWADAFEARLREDPDGTRRLIAQNGRRFMGLVALRERNPSLYKLKIRELSLQGEARKVALAYHAVKETGRTDDIRRAEDRLRVAAKAAVDAGLFARAEELKALDETVQRFRQELEHDAGRAAQEVDALVKQLMERPPSAGMFGEPGIKRSSDDAPSSSDGAPADGKPAGPPVDVAPQR